MDNKLGQIVVKQFLSIFSSFPRSVLSQQEQDMEIVRLAQTKDRAWHRHRHGERYWDGWVYAFFFDEFVRVIGGYSVIS